MLRRVGARVPVLLLLVLVWSGGDAHAQTDAPTPSEENGPRFCTPAATHHSFDHQGLALLYCDAPPALDGLSRGAHASARPIFYGAVPAAWGWATFTQEPAAVGAAYRLTLTQGLAYGLILGLKHAVARPRPYVNLSLRARSERHRPPSRDAYLSFPSGHAGLSAAIATSWSLSHPRWYVIGAGALWASGVTLSRVYLGVHYPSDVLVGATLGVGVALLVHQLRTVLTPPRLQASGAHGLRGLPLTLRLRF